MFGCGDLKHKSSFDFKGYGRGFFRADYFAQKSYYLRATTLVFVVDALPFFQKRVDLWFFCLNWGDQALTIKEFHNGIGASVSVTPRFARNEETVNVPLFFSYALILLT